MGRGGRERGERRLNAPSLEEAATLKVFPSEKDDLASFPVHESVSSERRAGRLTVAELLWGPPRKLAIEQVPLAPGTVRRVWPMVLPCRFLHWNYGSSLSTALLCN